MLLLLLKRIKNRRIETLLSVSREFFLSHVNVSDLIYKQRTEIGFNAIQGDEKETLRSTSLR